MHEWLGPHGMVTVAGLRIEGLSAWGLGSVLTYVDGLARDGSGSRVDSKQKGERVLYGDAIVGQVIHSVAKANA